MCSHATKSTCQCCDKKCEKLTKSKPLRNTIAARRSDLKLARSAARSKVIDEKRDRFDRNCHSDLCKRTPNQKQVTFRQNLLNHVTTQHQPDDIDVFRPFLDIITNAHKPEDVMRLFRFNFANFLNYIILLETEPLFQKVHTSALRFMALGDSVDEACINAVARHKHVLNKLVIQRCKPTRETPTSTAIPDQTDARTLNETPTAMDNTQ